MLNAFPRIGHLQGSQRAAGDLLLNPSAEHQLLRSQVVVYEKLDGINVAIGRGSAGLRLAVRQPWARSLDGAVIRAVDIYVRQRDRALRGLLGSHGLLYGEWLWHRVSTRYPALPDLLILFALRRGRGWVSSSTLRRAAARAGLSAQQPLWQGVLHDVKGLRRLLGPSTMGAPRMEGLIVERAGSGRGPRWGKWVEPSYRHVEAGALTGEHNQLRRTRGRRGSPSDDAAIRSAAVTRPCR